MCFSPQRRAIFRQQNVKKCSEDYSFSTFSLANVLFATAAYNYSTSERPKVLRRLQFFNIFTSECAFRHSRVQFFHICTSKSGPGTTWQASVSRWHLTDSLLTSDHIKHIKTSPFETQWSQVIPGLPKNQTPKDSYHELICALYVLPLLIMKGIWVLPIIIGWGLFNISEHPPYHSGVQFLMSPLTTYLRTRRFNGPTFRLTGHTNHWKNTAFRDFPIFLLTFWLLHLLSSDLTTLLLVFSSAFQLSILSEVSI